jgi:predicted N-acetyltransferase YhbS
MSPTDVAPCVRCARKGELLALVATINRAFTREAWLIPGPRISLDELVLDVVRAGTTLLVAHQDGEIAGVVRVRTAPPIAEIGLLGVEPARQGRGIGALLMGAAERAAAGAGCKEMELLCGRELGMDAYYAALGYRAIAAAWGAHFGSLSPFTLVTMRKACARQPYTACSKTRSNRARSE